MMESFLINTKQIQEKLSDTSTVHVVLGNESCDLDSAVSAIVYAFYLSKKFQDSVVIPVLNIPESQFRLRTETTHFFNKLNIQSDSLTFRDQIHFDTLHAEGRLKLCLVDHNALTGSDVKYTDCVAIVIDHHVRECQEKEGVRVKLDFVGSCCTLVAEELLEDPDFEVDHTVAELLLGTILVDTINRSVEAGKVTPRDENVLDKLQLLIPSVKGDNLYKELQTAKFDMNNLLNMEILEKDLKMVPGSGMTIAMASVTMDMEELLKRPNFQADLAEFSTKKEADVVVIMTLITDMNDKPSRQIAVYSSNRIYKDQIADVLDNDTDENLELEPCFPPFDSISVFKQGNVKASRKKVMPILKSFLQGDVTPDVTSKEFVTQQSVSIATEGFSSFSSLLESGQNSENDGTANSKDASSALVDLDSLDPFGKSSSDLANNGFASEQDNAHLTDKQNGFNANKNNSNPGIGFDIFATQNSTSDIGSNTQTDVKNVRTSDNPFADFSSTNLSSVNSSNMFDFLTSDSELVDPFSSVEEIPTSFPNQTGFSDFTENESKETGLNENQPLFDIGMDTQSEATVGSSDIQTVSTNPFFDIPIDTSQPGEIPTTLGASVVFTNPSEVNSNNSNFSNSGNIFDDLVMDSANLVNVDTDMGSMVESNNNPFTIPFKPETTQPDAESEFKGPGVNENSNLIGNESNPNNPFLVDKNNPFDLPAGVDVAEQSQFEDMTDDVNPFQMDYLDVEADNQGARPKARKSISLIVEVDQHSTERLDELSEADFFDKVPTPDVEHSGETSPFVNSGISSPQEGELLQLRDGLSTKSSGYPSISTPPNSVMEGSGFETLDHDLPSFNSAEMVERIQRKKASLGNIADFQEMQDDVKNSVPFTPRNSFRDDVPLPSVNLILPEMETSDMEQTIKEKRNSLIATQEFTSAEDDLLGLSMKTDQRTLPLSQNNNSEIMSTTYYSGQTVDDLVDTPGDVFSDSGDGAHNLIESVPFTPANSYIDSSGASYMQDRRSLPDAELFNRLNDLKRQRSDTEGNSSVCNEFESGQEVRSQEIVSDFNNFDPFFMELEKAPESLDTESNLFEKNPEPAKEQTDLNDEEEEKRNIELLSENESTLTENEKLSPFSDELIEVSETFTRLESVQTNIKAEVELPEDAKNVFDPFSVFVSDSVEQRTELDLSKADMKPEPESMLVDGGLNDLESLSMDHEKQSDNLGSPFNINKDDEEEMAKEIKLGEKESEEKSPDLFDSLIDVSVKNPDSKISDTDDLYQLEQSEKTMVNIQEDIMPPDTLETDPNFETEVITKSENDFAQDVSEKVTGELINNSLIDVKEQSNQPVLDDKTIEERIIDVKTNQFLETQTQLEIEMLSKAETEIAQAVSKTVTSELINEAVETFPDMSNPALAECVTMEVLQDTSSDWTDQGSGDSGIGSGDSPQQGTSLPPRSPRSPRPVPAAQYSLETDYLPSMDPLHGNLNIVTSPASMTQSVETDANKEVVEGLSFRRISCEVEAEHIPEALKSDDATALPQVSETSIKDMILSENLENSQVSDLDPYIDDLPKQQLETSHGVDDLPQQPSETSHGIDNLEEDVEVLDESGDEVKCHANDGISGLAKDEFSAIESLQDRSGGVSVDNTNELIENNVIIKLPLVVETADNTDDLIKDSTHALKPLDSEVVGLSEDDSDVLTKSENLKPDSEDFESTNLTSTLKSGEPEDIYDISIVKDSESMMDENEAVSSPDLDVEDKSDVGDTTLQPERPGIPPNELFIGDVSAVTQPAVEINVEACSISPDSSNSYTSSTDSEVDLITVRENILDASPTDVIDHLHEVKSETEHQVQDSGIPFELENADGDDNIGSETEIASSLQSTQLPDLIMDSDVGTTGSADNELLGDSDLLVDNNLAESTLTIETISPAETPEHEHATGFYEVNPEVKADDTGMEQSITDTKLGDNVTGFYEINPDVSQMTQSGLSIESVSPLETPDDEHTKGFYEVNSLSGTKTPEISVSMTESVETENSEIGEPSGFYEVNSEIKGTVLQNIEIGDAFSPVESPNDDIVGISYQINPMIPDIPNESSLETDENDICRSDVSVFDSNTETKTSFDDEPNSSDAILFNMADGLVNEAIKGAYEMVYEIQGHEDTQVVKQIAHTTLTNDDQDLDANQEIVRELEDADAVDDEKFNESSEDSDISSTTTEGSYRINCSPVMTPESESMLEEHVRRMRTNEVYVIEESANEDMESELLDNVNNNELVAEVHVNNESNTSLFNEVERVDKDYSNIEDEGLFNTIEQDESIPTFSENYNDKETESIEFPQFANLDDNKDEIKEVTEEEKDGGSSNFVTLTRQETVIPDIIISVDDDEHLNTDIDYENDKSEVTSEDNGVVKETEHSTANIDSSDNSHVEHKISDSQSKNKILKDSKNELPNEAKVIHEKDPDRNIKAERAADQVSDISNISDSSTDNSDEVGSIKHSPNTKLSQLAKKKPVREESSVSITKSKFAEQEYTTRKEIFYTTAGRMSVSIDSVVDPPGLAEHISQGGRQNPISEETMQLQIAYILAQIKETTGQADDILSELNKSNLTSIEDIHGFLVDKFDLHPDLHLDFDLDNISVGPQPGDEDFDPLDLKDVPTETTDQQHHQQQDNIEEQQKSVLRDQQGSSTAVVAGTSRKTNKKKNDGKMKEMEDTQEWHEDPIPGMGIQEDDLGSSESESESDSDSEYGKPARPDSLLSGKRKKKILANSNIVTNDPNDDLDDDLPTPDDLETPDDMEGELEWEDDTPITPSSEKKFSDYIHTRDDDDDDDGKEYEQNSRMRKVEIAGKDYKVDMHVIEPYKKVLSHGGYYGDGLNAIILFCGCYLPDRSRRDYQYVMDNLFLYVISTLELLVAEDYMIVYFHGATPRRQMPSFGWLKRCYQMIDRRLRKNLKALLMVHPTLWLKTVVMMTKPFISSKFSSKLRFVKTLQELGKIVPMEYIYVPDPVQQYDSKLKQQRASSSSTTPVTPISPS